MAKKNRETFGSVLKKLRKNKSLSIKKLSSKLDINYSYISKLENDKTLPSVDFIDRISKVFDYDKEELLIRAGKLPDDIIKILQNNPKEAVKILRAKFFDDGRSR